MLLSSTYIYAFAEGNKSLKIAKNTKIESIVHVHKGMCSC